MRCLKDIMTENVISVSAGMAIRKAAEVFSVNKISGAVVVDESGHRVGVVTKTDFLKPFLAGLDSAHVDNLDDIGIMAARGGTTLHQDKEMTAVRDIMSDECVTLPPESSIMTAVSLMVTSRLRRIFVERAGQIVGVVSAIDVLAALAQIEAEHQKKK